MDQQSIERQIEHLRQRLYMIADIHQGNLLHPQVIQASQALDVAIHRFTTLKRCRTAAVS
jgi:hypothetical protein